MASVNRLRLLALLLAMAPAGRADAMQAATMPEYIAHLERLRTLVQACQASVPRCDPQQVGGDDLVSFQGLGAGANIHQFEAHYDWLRSTLKDAQKSTGKTREMNLTAADARIEEAIDDASAQAPAGNFSTARKAADAVLAHPEFATVEEQSIWDRIIAHILLWIDRLFNDVETFGERSPWIGPVIEIGLIVLAFTILAVWAMRSFRRQRLAVKLESARQLEPWEEASQNWRRLAEEQAAQKAWREAVHCLYWASIVMLEGRKFWTANRSRTPREYLRLLEAGSTRWNLLRRQTLSFERIWYGLNTAVEEDYRNALHVHEELRAA